MNSIWSHTHPNNRIESNRKTTTWLSRHSKKIFLLTSKVQKFTKKRWFTIRNGQFPFYRSCVLVFKKFQLHQYGKRRKIMYLSVSQSQINYRFVINFYWLTYHNQKKIKKENNRLIAIINIAVPWNQKTTGHQVKVSKISLLWQHFFNNLDIIFAENGSIEWDNLDQTSGQRK